MKILMLVEALNIGGLPNLVLDLSRALQASGETVRIAHLGREVPAHLDTRALDVTALDPSGEANSADIVRRIAQWQPDVVHVHLCSDNQLLDALARAGWPLVRSFHDYTSLCLRRGRRRFPGDRCHRALGPGCLAFGCSIGRALPGQGGLIRIESLSEKMAECKRYRAFDAAVVGSRHMHQTLLLNGFDRQRAKLIPYFSRFDDLAQGLRAMPPKAPGVPGVDRPLRWLFAGQAVKGKGLTVLVKALAGIEEPWTLTAVTRGPELPQAQALARSAGLSDRIDFRDWVPQDQLADLYRQSDVFVVPSVWDDPGPLVGLEAMSAETPVVAFPVGGLPDYVHEDQTGWLAADVSVGALRAALRRALIQAPELPRIGRQAREWVATKHGRRQHIEQMRALYRGVLKPVENTHVMEGVSP